MRSAITHRSMSLAITHRSMSLALSVVANQDFHRKVGGQEDRVSTSEINARGKDTIEERKEVLFAGGAFLKR